MHSNHYGSFTIHYNGDYSGPYTINNTKRNEFGEVIENKWNSPSLKKIKYSSFNRLVNLTKTAISNKQKQIRNAY